MVAIPMLSFLFRNGETARMSLIHEALQKAETERRAGELPSLVSMPATPRGRERGTHRPLWFALGIAVLAALAYANRDLILAGGDDPNAQRVASSRDVPGEKASAAATTAASSQVARKPTAVQQAPAAAPVMDAFTAAQTDAIAAHLGAGHGVVTPEATMASAPDANTAPLPIPKPAPPLEAPETTATAMAEVAMAEPEVHSSKPVAAVDNQSAQPPAAPADEPMQATAPAAAPGDANGASPAVGVPLIFELPLATRQALPPMKVTMQVYHQDPKLRFAMIDGKRVNEHGVVGNDLTLIEIQRDAMLLEFRGTRFLMPRLGR